MNQPVVQRRIRNRVGNAGAGWHRPMLDAQMGRPVRLEAQQRAVPAPDGAVVQAQVRQPLHRFGAQIHRQQRRIVRQIFDEQFQQRFPDIIVAEGDSPVAPVVGMHTTGQGHALLEHRNAGFLP